MSMIADARRAVQSHEQLAREARAALEALEEDAHESFVWVRAAAAAVVFVAAFALTTWVLREMRAAA